MRDRPTYREELNGSLPRDLLIFMIAGAAAALFIFLGALLPNSRGSARLGMFPLLGSMPWSAPWLDGLFAPFATIIGWPARHVLDDAIVSLGFALNCALIYMGVVQVRKAWTNP